MNDEIVLDRESFRALSSQTRVNIIKSLAERRKTLTELSHEMRITPSTAKEHLEILEKYGLVVKIDEQRKWKYYELTPKGRRILQPRGFNIVILLSFFFLIIFSLVFMEMVRQTTMASLVSSPSSPLVSEHTFSVSHTNDSGGEHESSLRVASSSKEHATSTAPSSEVDRFSLVSLDTLLTAVLVVSVLLALAILSWWFTRKRV